MKGCEILKGVKIFEKIFHNKKGSAEIVAFLLILPFLILPLFNSLQNYIALNKADAIKQVTRYALLRAETDGGLTQDDVNEITTILQQKGFNTSQIHIDYTPYPVQYGDQVTVKISYNTILTNFTIGLGGLKRVEQPFTMSYGPITSISKHYTRIP